MQVPQSRGINLLRQELGRTFTWSVPSYTRNYSYASIPIFRYPSLFNQYSHFNSRHPLRLGIQFVLYFNCLQKEFYYRYFISMDIRDESFIQGRHRNFQVIHAWNLKPWVHPFCPLYLDSQQLGAINLSHYSH